jgi:hypothetical protein
MKVTFEPAMEYDATVWIPSMGRIAPDFGYDTETTVETDRGVVPQYVIGTAFDGQKICFIMRQDLGAFWCAHTGSVAYMHTAAFDLEVTTAACRYEFHSMIDQGRIRDIAIYYRLLKCATTGEVPHRYGLDLLSAELLGVVLDKDEAIRKDFGRFYHNGNVDYGSIPVDYLVYAARDAIATYRLAGQLEPQCRFAHLKSTPAA